MEASCGEGVARDRPVRVLPCPGCDLGALLLVATLGPSVKTKTVLGILGAGGMLPKGCEEGAVWGRGERS